MYLVGVLVYGYVAGIDSQHLQEAETGCLLHTMSSIAEQNNNENDNY